MFAKAISTDPIFLVADEPTSNLDFDSERDLCAQLVELKNDHNIVVVTHSPMLLEACDNIIVLSQGEIALAGKTQDILARLMRA